MLRKISKASICLSCLLLLTAVFFPVFPTASATNTTFQVNVKETLSVSISTPDSDNWASGNINEFLRNKVTISVVSNNANGFVAGMTAGNSGATLTNTAKSTVNLATLTSGTTWNRSSDVTNFWGYSLDDGLESGTYNPMVGSDSAPTEIFDSNSGDTSKDVYFGAKADISQASGTYAGTVIISVITGTTDMQSAPSNPATPNDNEGVAEYDGSNTTYPYSRTSGGVTTATTRVSDGNNTSSYSGYTPPQGVTDSSISSISSNSSLATGLAVTASVAAASGIFFFIVAKRKKDDEEEDE